MNKFIVWLAGGENEVQEIKEISKQVADYGVDNITIHPRGGVKVKITKNVTESEAKKLKEIVAIS